MKRVIGGAIIAALVILFGWLGGLPLLCFTMGIACIAMFELFRVAGAETNRWTWICYPLVILYYLILRTKSFTPYLLGAILLILLIYLLFFRNRKLPLPLLMTGGVFCVGIFFSSIYENRVPDDGTFYLALMLITSWLTDVGAFCAGKLFGKHHIFPKLSPKKTAEGCIGGIIFGTLICFLLSWILKRDVCFFTAIGFFASILSEAGDLTASAFKRTYGAKDYGNLIPGHGGILDRFDSTLFTGAFIYLCISLFL